MLPNFLVIGAQKSATTWLYSRLKEHPEVFVSKTKEIGFFNGLSESLLTNNTYEKLGISWYEKFFEGAYNYKVIGEFTPIYISDILAPERIKKELGEPKIIAILRNPISRAYSHYWMAYNKLQTKKEFRQLIIENDAQFIQRGLYYSQLKRYYEIFPKENIHIILMEDIYNNPQLVLKNVCRFLQVNSDFHFSAEKQENKSSSLKFPVFYMLMEKYIQKIRKSKFSFVIDIIKNLKLDDYIKKISKKEVNYPNLSIEDKKSLVIYYREDILKLSKLINRDLSFWLENK